MAETIKTIDPTIRQSVAISSIPAAIDDVSLITLSGLAAGAVHALILNISPDTPGLKLWNFRRQYRVDTNDIDHKWPEGGSLTADQFAVRVIDEFYDPMDSNDFTGVAQYKIVFHNQGSSPHDIHLLFKAMNVGNTAGNLS